MQHVFVKLNWMSCGYTRYDRRETAPSNMHFVHSCFIVDTSGYLVYHEDFTHKHNEEVEYIHIIQKVPSDSE